MGYLHHTGENIPASFEADLGIPVQRDADKNDPSYIPAPYAPEAYEWPEGFTWAETQGTDGYPVAVSKRAWEKFPGPCTGMTLEELTSHKEAGWRVEE